MKKLFFVFLCFLFLIASVGCSSNKEEDEGENKHTFKVGMVCIGDTTEGYTSAHVNGLNAASEKLGFDVIYKYNCGDGGETVQNALEDLVEEGCDMVISNSYGHQYNTIEVAKENPDIYFVASTGDNAQASGLNNYTNAFPATYQSRYVAGVVAGLKLSQLIDENKLTSENYDEVGNIKIGYVSAFPYAECVSGYTAFYLGVKSIVNNVVMYVTYTSDWSDATLEQAGAEALIAKGCVIISQHADTTGAPSAIEAAHVEKGKEVYCVGYNVSMLSVAPESALTSATNNWEIAYTELVSEAMNGQGLTEWCAGYKEGAQSITELGKNCAPGTADKVAEVEAKILNDELHVFDVSTFTVNGETISENSQCVDGFFLDAIGGNAIYDGYFHESEYRSAPYFCAAVDGIVSID